MIMDQPTRNRPTRERIEQSRSLEEALRVFFGVEVNGRTTVLEEAMEGDVARAYDGLGKGVRQETYERIAADFIERTGYRGRTTIIDVGCGSGLLAIALAKKGARVTGVDISTDMLALAQENIAREGLGSKVRLVHGPVSALPSLVTPATYIVCRNALHRMRNPDVALAVMLGMLRDDGWLYVRDLRRDAPWEILRARIGKERWERPELVRDYIGALAGALTIPELEAYASPLEPFTRSCTITDGSYTAAAGKIRPGLPEFERDAELVLVMQKKAREHWCARWR